MDAVRENGLCRLSLNVRGRVQGVGFRYFVRSAARQLELDGWVKNELDGSVSILAEGTRGDLQRLKSAVVQGPPGARVDRVEEAWDARRGDVNGFKVRF